MLDGLLIRRTNAARWRDRGIPRSAVATDEKTLKLLLILEPTGRSLLSPLAQR